MANRRSPRGVRDGERLAALRVSKDEAKFVVEKAAQLGISIAQLRRDRLFFDMPGYKVGQ